MRQEDLIERHVLELRRTHGKRALDAAQTRMREEMDKGDVREAGIWLSVMYELTRCDAKKAHP